MRPSFSVSGPLGGNRPRPSVTAFEGDHGERGQALVEFAFVVPILLLFLLTVVDFGLAMDHRLLLQHAVREGARTAATGASESEIVDVTADQAGMDPSDLTVTVCYEDLNTNGVADAGDDVRVDADFSYQLLFRVIDVSPPAIDMKPSADMRLERDAPLGAVC